MIWQCYLVLMAINAIKDIDIYSHLKIFSINDNILDIMIYGTQWDNNGILYSFLDVLVSDLLKGQYALYVVKYSCRRSVQHCETIFVILTLYKCGHIISVPSSLG